MCRTNLLLNAPLKEKLQKKAAALQLPLNEVIRTLLARALEAEEQRERERLERKRATK